MPSSVRGAGWDHLAHVADDRVLLLVPLEPVVAEQAVDVVLAAAPWAKSLPKALADSVTCRRHVAADEIGRRPRAAIRLGVRHRRAPQWASTLANDRLPGAVDTDVPVDEGRCRRAPSRPPRSPAGSRPSIGLRARLRRSGRPARSQSRGRPAAGSRSEGRWLADRSRRPRSSSTSPSTPLSEPWLPSMCPRHSRREGVAGVVTLHCEVVRSGRSSPSSPSGDSSPRPRRCRVDRHGLAIRRAHDPAWVP